MLALHALGLDLLALVRFDPRLVLRLGNLPPIIAAAKKLGIKLSNALGSVICEAWADRVRRAKACFDEGRMDECQRAIEDANAYAT